MPPDSDPRTLSTVHRAFDVVEVLRRADGARVHEVAEALDIAPSTAHKHLATLREELCVVKEGQSYHVGLGFLDIGSYVKYRKAGYRRCSQKTAEIAAETGERVQFVVEEHGLGIYVNVDAADSSAVMTDRRDGVRRHLHATAAGKAILANLPADRVVAIADRHGLPAETEATTTDLATLQRELTGIREAGIAYNDEESVEGLRAVGVPITRPDGAVLGAFSLSGPSRRLRERRYREELPNLLLGHANEVELNLRYDD
jgi:DNA-binding IclR family transcriptional regulator